MAQRARYFHIQLLTHGNQNKTARIIWALQGRFENGQITLNRGDWNDQFLDELFQFPDQLTHDDLIDSLAYVDQLANESYFSEFTYDDEAVFTDSAVGY
jgi:phage terminase large subunit-like protein